MSDPTTLPPTGDNTPKGDGSGNAAEITRLSQQLSQVQAELAVKENALKELEAAKATLAQANEQANAQLAKFKADFESANTQLGAKGAELQNWMTQHGQLNQQLGDFQAKLTQAEAELNLFKTIASKPEFHPLIGAIDAIKVTPDKTEQEKVLATMAAAFKMNTDALLSQFRAGATTTNGSTANGSVGNGAAQFGSLEQAFSAYQQSVGVPGREAQAKAAKVFIDNASQKKG